MNNGKDSHHVEITIRDNNFRVIEEAKFSGKSAIVDGIYLLDKYCNALDVIKKFW